jgi:hypothetical protein
MKLCDSLLTGPRASASGYPLLLRTLCLTALALPAVPANAPTFENEQLHYSVNWPSGLSLGEAEFGASSSKDAVKPAERLHLQFDLNAGVPGFSVSDRYRSEASPEFCSAEFQRTASHGSKKTDEKITFDANGGRAMRETVGGGNSELDTSACGRDALAFLYYVRHELSQGRIPPSQTVFLGAPYEVRLEFAGTQSIRIGDKPVEADRVNASVKGPSSGVNFEVFFLKDRVRTPALVRVPLALGTFTMELVR